RPRGRTRAARRPRLSPDPHSVDHKSGALGRLLPLCQEREEFFSRPMQVSKDRSDGDAFELGDFLAGITLDLEQHEGRAPLCVHLADDLVHQLSLSLRVEKLALRRSWADDRLQRLLVVAAKEAAKPGAAPMVANHERGNLVKPGR